MSDWQPTWEKDPQSGYYITPAAGGGFLIASVEQFPRFCFFADTRDEARDKVAGAIRFYERSRAKTPEPPK